MDCDTVIKFRVFGVGKNRFGVPRQQASVTGFFLAFLWFCFSSKRGRSGVSDLAVTVLRTNWVRILSQPALHNLLLPRSPQTYTPCAADLRSHTRDIQTTLSLIFSIWLVWRGKGQPH